MRRKDTHFSLKYKILDVKYSFFGQWRFIHEGREKSSFNNIVHPYSDFVQVLIGQCPVSLQPKSRLYEKLSF